MIDGMIGLGSVLLLASIAAAWGALFEASDHDRRIRDIEKRLSWMTDALERLEAGDEPD